MIIPHIIRLIPGDDLRTGIQDYVNRSGLQAGWVSACVGSLVNFNIRFANQPSGNSGTGHFEIISLSGTVSINGTHLHIAISDSDGNCIGGHLMDGCKIYSTAEIVILSSDTHHFSRTLDEATGFRELAIKHTKGK